MERLVSFAGVLVLLGIGYAFSTDRRRIPWRVVVLGTLLQAWLAVFIVRPEWSRMAATATAVACIGALLLPRLFARLPQGLPEFSRLVAEGLGILGVAIVLAQTGLVLGRLGALGALALGIPLVLLWRRFPAVLLGTSLAGLAAVPALLWAGALPRDF